MQTLTVVNMMLATMGEKPLNALTDPHNMRGACTSTLERENRRLQAKGWWFNTEELTINPGGLDSGLYLPGDFLAVRPQNPERRHLVQRGNRIYNKVDETFSFTEPEDVYLIRFIPFEDAPELFANYVAAEATLRFQMHYDGDSQRTKELLNYRQECKIEADAEHIRQARVNLIYSHPRLYRLKTRSPYGGGTVQ